MLETSKDLLFIAIAIAVLALGGYLSYLFYSLAKLVQESKRTVEDVNKKLEKIDPLVDNTTETVNSLMSTVQAIDNGILKPIASLSDVIKNIRSAAAIMKGKK